MAKAKAKSTYVANGKAKANGVHSHGKGGHTPSSLEPETDELPWFPSITTFYGFGILIVLGWFRDLGEGLLGFLRKPKKVRCHLTRCGVIVCVCWERSQLPIGLVDMFLFARDWTRMHSVAGPTYDRSSEGPPPARCVVRAWIL